MKNNKITFVLFFVFVNIHLFAQIDPASLLELNKGTASEMNATTPAKGALLYNTDDDKVYRFDGTNWSAVGEVDLTPYLDNTDDQKITDFSLSGTTLTLTLEDGGTKTVEMNSLSHTGTEGSVFFAGNDTKPTEDNANLFWDNANKRLGIGTSSPSAALEITPANISSIQEGVRLVDLGGGSSEGLWIQFGQNSIRDYARMGGISENNASGGLYFSTKDDADAAPIERMRIVANGNLGIGTNSPDEKLHVAGNMRLDGAFEDKDGDPGTAGQILASTATGTDWINFAQSNSSSVSAGNWYRIAKNTGGKRANADFTLRDPISGGGHSTLNFKVGVSYNDATNMAFTLLSHSYYYTPTFTKVRVLENSTYDEQYLEVYCERTGPVEYSIYDNQQSSGWEPVDWTAGAIPAGYTAREFDVKGLFNVGNSTDQFTIARDGNVGLGITNPSSKLHVMGDIQLGGSDTRLIRFRNAANNDHASIGELNGGLVLSGHSAANVAGHEHLFINNQGNVGIGTIAPSGKLHVSSGTDGDAKLIIEADTDDDNEDDNPILIFKQDGGIEESAIEQTHNELHIRNSISSGGGLVFDVGAVNGYENAAEAMRIIPDGKIGMGTASPAEKLDVQGNIAHSGGLYSRGPSYTFEWMRFADHQWGNSLVLGAGGNTILGGGEFAWTAQPNFGTSDETLVLGSDSNISFFTNTQNGWDDRKNVMFLTNSARVGINTSSPSTDLDVNGQMRIRNIPAGSGSQWLVKDGSGNIRVQASDFRLKKNITSIENSLDKVMHLDGKYFDWKDDSRHDIGFIAQDVEKILPELVSETDDGYKALNYPQITAVLVNAVKELKQENDILRKQVNSHYSVSGKIGQNGELLFGSVDVEVKKIKKGHFYIKFNSPELLETYTVNLSTDQKIRDNGDPVYINLTSQTKFGFEVAVKTVDAHRVVSDYDTEWTFNLIGKIGDLSLAQAEKTSLGE